MSLVLTEQGCHTWVVTAGAAGPILAIDGDRLEDHNRGGAGGAAPTTPDPAPSAPQRPVLDTSARGSPAATGDDADPTITTCPGSCQGPLPMIGLSEVSSNLSASAPCT